MNEDLQLGRAGQWIIFFLLLMVCPQDVSAQVLDPFSPRIAPVQESPKEPIEKKSDSPVVKKSTETQTDVPATPKIDLPPTYVKLHLNDGDIVSGELNATSIAMATEFGTLSVPIERIIRFEPGLMSYPQLLDQLDQLVEDLGSNKYELRQSAHRKLVEMGPKIRNELARFEDDGNAERKRHLTEIRKEITAIIDEFDEEELEDPDNQPWVKHDRLVTAKFTAVGKIQQNEFRLKGKYGVLDINLSDIKRGSRPSGGREPIQKSITVNQENFVQLSWKSSGVTIEKGDSITVSARGTMTLTPWGTNAISTPNGTPQYGVMPNTPGIPFGAVVARIGNGKYFLVGQKKTFRAKASGKLEFGVTMQKNYVGKSYRFPGEYKLKVKVEPGAEED